MLGKTADRPECWPILTLDSWRDTYATLHMWTQMVGKVRLALTPLVNHWWNVPLYVSALGLTTSRIPYGQRAFEIWFDFLKHQLVLGFLIIHLHNDDPRCFTPATLRLTVVPGIV